MTWKVTCLVDNTALPLSAFWAEHGVSFLVEGDGGRLLFDCGQSGTVLAHNLSECGNNLRGLDAVVISHGHHDHGGGLAEVARRCPGVPLFAHPAAMDDKHARHGDKLERIALPLGREELEKRFSLRLGSRPVEVVPGAWTTGEVERRAPFETPTPGMLVRQAGGLVADTVPDDQSLVLETPRGPVLLLGCCHAGLVNTLWQVRHRQPAAPKVILGGAHLFRATPARLKQTVKVLRDLDAEVLAFGHCTGAEPVFYLRRELGERVTPLHAGESWEF